eukprot:Opistho-2@44633
MGNGASTPEEQPSTTNDKASGAAANNVKKSAPAAPKVIVSGPKKGRDDSSSEDDDDDEDVAAADKTKKGQAGGAGGHKEKDAPAADAKEDATAKAGGARKKDAQKKKNDDNKTLGTAAAAATKGRSGSLTPRGKSPTAPRGEGPGEGTFDTFVREDGVMFTTYVDASGQRFYVDWDYQTWVPFPKDWLKQGVFESERQAEQERAAAAHANTNAAMAIGGPAAAAVGLGDGMDEQGRVGTFKHPNGHVYQTYVFEVHKNVRYYFDDSSASWLRMPVELEKEVPEVQKMLKQIKTVLPKWKDDQEMIRALRENDYDVQDTLNWKMSEDSYNKKDGAGGKSPKPHHSDFEVLASIKLKLQETEVKLEEKTHELLKLHAELMELKKSAAKGGGGGGGDARTAKELAESHHQLKEREAQLRQNEDRIMELEHENQRLRDEGSRHATVATDASHVTQELEEVRQQLSAAQLKLKKANKKNKKQTEALKKLGKAAKEVKGLQKTVVTLKQQATTEFAAFAPLLLRFDDALRQMRVRYGDIDGVVAELRAKYRAENIQRRLLYNKLQELRGNIRIFCRCRRDDTGPLAVELPSESELVVTNTQGRASKFEFERIYMPSSTQSEVFTDTEPIITSCLDGYNVCILAYGQTGAGKTFTMMGTKADPGVNVRALTELFKISKARVEVEHHIIVSLVEIYNEQIIDLLGDPATSRAAKNDVCRGPTGNYVPGLTEVEVNSIDDVIRVMATGDKNRSVAATSMNSSSSRSHLILTIAVSCTNRLSKETLHGKLTLVDLAGSERVSRSDAQGQRLVEAAAINKSLSALGQVFQSLRTKALHIPYRNSKLTHLLQDSLGGDSKTCMFLNISPLTINADETLSTLNFGKAISGLEFGPAKKHVEKAPPR